MTLIERHYTNVSNVPGAALIQSLETMLNEAFTIILSQREIEISGMQLCARAENTRCRTRAPVYR